MVIMCDKFQENLTDIYDFDFPQFDCNLRGGSGTDPAFKKVGVHSYENVKIFRILA